MEDKDLKTKLILGVVLLTSLLLFKLSFKTISPGTVGVVTRLGKITGRILEPGPHFIIPFIEKVLVYNTKKVIYEATSLEKQSSSHANYKDYPVDTNTKDGQEVNIYYTIRFSIDPKKVTWIAQNIGSEFYLVEKVVKADSRIWVRNIVREYDAEHLYTGNVQDVQTKIEQKLKPIFKNNGIILDEVGIREIKFNPEYIKAIEQKQIEAVKIEIEKNKAQQAKYQKEQRITQAEALAKEQELLRSTLTDEMIKKMWIEKWDGKLPTYMGQGILPFFDLNR